MAPKNIGLIVAGVVLVLVVAVGAYFTLGNNVSKPTVDDAMMADEKSEDDSIMSAGSIRSLFGKNVTCTFENSDDSGNTNSGTVYVAGERMRGDFTSIGPAEDIESHMIRDGEYGYVWSDAFEGGTKVKLDEDSSDEKDNKGVDLDDPVDMNCQSWSVDTSFFELPANIEFTDVSASMEKMEETMSSVCESISEPSAKAACIEQIGN